MLQTLARAWTSRDYEKVIGFFAPDIRYADPLHYSFSNSADLLRFFQDDGGYPQSTVWHNILFDEDRQIGAAEYSYRGTHLYHGAVLIKVQGDRITHWREYQHITDKEWEPFTSGTAFESVP
jgi:hypothetical protein